MPNFLERQKQAQHNTTWLVVLYLLSLGATVATTAGLLWIIFGPTAGWIAAGVMIIVIAGGSLSKSSELRQGGFAIAERLGGTRLQDPDNAEERRVLNVVEEMAIASGVSVPAVYVLEEDGINSFAAGYTPDDAAIGVTRGAIETLSRAELQGMIAHEFSHILSGDMRLNVRLIAWTYGIQMIMTQWIAIPVVQATSWIGLMGFLGASLMKSYVSKEREFLADAAAVQFTRNPKGVGGALAVIREHEAGAILDTDNADTMSHLFFASAVEEKWFSFATHPSPTERILRIDPEIERESLRAAAAEPGQASPQPADEPDEAPDPTADEIVDRAGTMGPDALRSADTLRAALPDALLTTVREPLGAVAVGYALVLDADATMREHQLDLLQERESPAVVDETKRTYPSIADLEWRLRLPLVELGAPALRDLSPDQRTRFRETLRALAEADDQLTIFEHALETIVRHQLDHTERPDSGAVMHQNVEAVVDDAVVVLSGLALAGHATKGDARHVFQMAYQSLAETHGTVPKALVDPKPEALDRALDRLAAAAPEVKNAVLSACVECVRADEHINEQEAALLRAVAAAMGVALPAGLDTGRDSASGARTTRTA